MLFKLRFFRPSSDQRALNFPVLVVLIAMLFSVEYAAAAVGDIGTYTSPKKTFSTASYWIEGVDGVVMIDTQYLPKEGLLAVQEAEKTTGKKVVAAIVLHPNPDKFNGTAAYQARGIRVLASRQTIKLIPSVHDIRLGWFFDEYSPDYPKLAAKPTEFCDKTMELGFFSKLKLQSKIENAYPQLGYKIFMRDGLAAVWKNEP